MRLGHLKIVKTVVDPFRKHHARNLTIRKDQDCDGLDVQFGLDFKTSKRQMTTIAERTKFPNVLLIEDNHGDALLVQRAFKKATIPGNVVVVRTAEVGLSVPRREGGYARGPYPVV